MSSLAPNSHPKAHLGFGRTLTNFAIGGISGMMATSIIQPVDTIKVRLQIRGEAGNSNLSPFDVAKEIKSQGGFKAFYRGLDSALLRQITYATTRFGIYLNLTQYMQQNLPKEKKNISFRQK
mmetsp:Transcript_38945/g.44533  ORF Transcript_38945/g.44533 Transcript_38945/m.44533 type:complete len:122 (-) Transcript_38945:516-881(-)